MARKCKAIIASVAFGLLATISVAQPLKKITEFRISDVPSASLDRLGNLYLVFKKGEIKKYDTDGNFLVEFSNPQSVPVTLLEPWNPLRVFLSAARNSRSFFWTE